MAGKVSSLYRLTDNQSYSVQPDANIWLSASAGTGKTQVLSARVLRLLLSDDVKPENILCLTYTKAGAAEMAERITSRLAHWVMLKDEALAADLAAIGAAVDPETLLRARRLFAAVLDAPGNGLAIQTIHSFCQALLGSFPLEAGLVPGLRPMDERDQKLLADQALVDILARAEADNDDALIGAVASLSQRFGEDRALSFLSQCARIDSDSLDPADIQRSIILEGLGLEPGFDRDALLSLMVSSNLPAQAMKKVALANQEWGTKTGKERGALIDQWQSGDDEQRLAGLGDLKRAIAAGSGQLFKTPDKLLAIDPQFTDWAHQLLAWINDRQAEKLSLDFAASYSGYLHAGLAFARRYNQVKRREAVMDYDDQIRETAKLLTTKDMAGWIRYKLDRRIDHILIDEAQDTNARQWEIVRALSDDFFVGEGAQPDRQRTLFTVGDYKQAIYSFQGTSPIYYEAAQLRFREIASSGPEPLQDLSLNQSFRTAQPVLDFVDNWLEILGPDKLGLAANPPLHKGEERPGQVVLMQPVGIFCEADDEEDWRSEPDRILADKIADQVKNWIASGLWLHKQKRSALAGDIMVLVRKRGDLARLIVARLFAKGIPVAGVDRLRIGNPLAIKDILSAARFSLQPDDDLNLANLLTSPILGWTHEQLMEHGLRPKGYSLWRWLRKQADNLPDQSLSLEPLYVILAMADYVTPYRFFEELLSGALQARRKLIGRLGRECLDPINELLIIAQSYGNNQPATMQGFLHWFDGDEDELKREVTARDEVRVMTVHGAKGLQAPIVILADSCADPNASQNMGFEWSFETTDHILTLPVPPLASADRPRAIDQAYAQKRQQDLQEYYRLGYVAMTRAEQMLVLTGSVDRKSMRLAADSWYTKAQEACGMLSEEGGVQQHVFGDAIVFGHGAVADLFDTPDPDQDIKPALPSWLSQPAQREERPPRPLAPTRLSEDDVLSRPAMTEDQRWAARRGILMHSLFERLLGHKPASRHDAAVRWLANIASDREEAEHIAIADDVMAVLNAPQWQDLFTTDALAEAPIAARVGADVISGTIDRLRIGDTVIDAIDFKTGRFVPAGIEDIPHAHLRQMAGYGAALQVLYPQHDIRLGLLYTHAPKLILIPQQTWLSEQIGG